MQGVEVNLYSLHAFLANSPSTLRLRLRNKRLPSVGCGARERHVTTSDAPGAWTWTGACCEECVCWEHHGSVQQICSVVSIAELQCHNSHQCRRRFSSCCDNHPHLSKAARAVSAATAAAAADADAAPPSPPAAALSSMVLPLTVPPLQLLSAAVAAVTTATKLASAHHAETLGATDSVRHEVRTCSAATRGCGGTRPYARVHRGASKGGPEGGREGGKQGGREGGREGGTTDGHRTERNPPSAAARDTDDGRRHFVTGYNNSPRDKRKQRQRKRQRR